MAEVKVGDSFTWRGWNGVEYTLLEKTSEWLWKIKSPEGTLVEWLVPKDMRNDFIIVAPYTRILKKIAVMEKRFNGRVRNV